MLISIFNGNHASFMIIPAYSIISTPTISSFILMLSTSSIIVTPPMRTPIISFISIPLIRLPSIAFVILSPILITLSEIRHILVSKSIRYRCIIVVIILIQNITIVLTANHHISSLVLIIESIIPFLCEFIPIELFTFFIMLCPWIFSIDEAEIWYTCALDWPKPVYAFTSSIVWIYH